MNKLPLLLGALISCQSYAADMSNWSDATVCRLVKNNNENAYIDEARTRGLTCNGLIAIETQAKTETETETETKINKPQPRKSLPSLPPNKFTAMSLADYKGAVCNSGSPASYWMDASPQNNKWAIILQGGGVALDAASYQGRGSEYKNSVLHDDNLKQMGYGVAFASLAKNSYNVIYLPYCSSDMYAGNHEHRIGGKSVPFKGRMIVKALVEDLSTYMDESDEVIIGGYSAGAIGTGFNLDLFESLPPQKKRYVFDSFWLDASELAFRKARPKNGQRVKQIVNFVYKTPPNGCRKNLAEMCFPSISRLQQFGITDAFVVWNRGDSNRKQKNNSPFEKAMEKEISSLGGGISVSEGYGRAGQHVVLFNDAYNQSINGLSPKSVFEAWLNGDSTRSTYIDYSK